MKPENNAENEAQKVKEEKEIQEIESQISRIKYLISQGRYEEAEKLADSIYVPSNLPAGIAASLNGKLQSLESTAGADISKQKTEVKLEQSAFSHKTGETSLISKDLLNFFDPFNNLGFNSTSSAIYIENQLLLKAAKDCYKNNPDFKNLTTEAQKKAIYEYAQKHTLPEMQKVVDNLKLEIVKHKLAIKFGLDHDGLGEKVKKLEIMAVNLDKSIANLVKSEIGEFRIAFKLDKIHAHHEEILKQQNSSKSQNIMKNVGKNIAEITTALCSFFIPDKVVQIMVKDEIAHDRRRATKKEANILRQDIGEKPKVQVMRRENNRMQDILNKHSEALLDGLSNISTKQKENLHKVNAIAHKNGIFKEKGATGPMTGPPMTDKDEKK